MLMKKKTSKSVLSAMLVAGGLMAALPAVSTPSFAQCGGKKAACAPKAKKAKKAKKGVCNPCAPKKAY